MLIPFIAPITFGKALIASKPPNFLNLFSTSYFMNIGTKSAKALVTCRVVNKAVDRLTLNFLLI